MSRDHSHTHTGPASASVNRKQLVYSAVGCLVAEDTMIRETAVVKSKSWCFSLTRTKDKVELMDVLARVSIHRWLSSSASCDRIRKRMGVGVNGEDRSVFFLAILLQVHS